jgi:hypothetical protein
LEGSSDTNHARLVFRGKQKYAHLLPDGERQTLNCHVRDKGLAGPIGEKPKNKKTR